MILVVGHMIVEPNERDRALALMRASVIEARSAPGCLDFALAPDIVEPARVNVCERWTDRASLEAFRGDGPADDLDSLIRSYSVHEYDV